MCTMQSQPRHASYSFSRSRIDPWINTSLFESPGERRSKITGTSPLLTNRGTRVCPRPPTLLSEALSCFSPRLTCRGSNTREQTDRQQSHRVCTCNFHLLSGVSAGLSGADAFACTRLPAFGKLYDKSTCRALHAKAPFPNLNWARAPLKRGCQPAGGKNTSVRTSMLSRGGAPGVSGFSNEVWNDSRARPSLALSWTRMNRTSSVCISEK